MKKLSIKTQKRTALGKKSTKELRANQNVPCVMYGGEENIHFYAHTLQFKDLIYTHEVHLVELDLDGKIYNAVLKEIQFHPVTDEILHIDFVQVFDKKPAIVTLPITLVGTSEGILAGGKLRQRRRSIKVKGLVTDMPDTLEIDITKLNIGQVIKIGDLNFENLEILDPAQAMVVGVVSSRVAAKGMEITEPETEAEEGEEGEETAAVAEEGAEEAPKAEE